MFRIFLTLQSADLMHRLCSWIDRQSFVCYAGSEAGRVLEAAIRIAPDLLVVDLDEPAGCAHVESFRDEPLLARKPILALSSSSRIEDRALSLALGATDLLRKPVDESTFSARIRAALVDGCEDRHPSNGSFDVFPATDLLQCLERRSASGLLELRASDSRGTMTLAEGRIVAAKLGPLGDLDALRAIAELRSGTFTFRPMRIRPSAPLLTTVAPFLVEIAAAL
jgi:CheY-like chemotaxis protein